VTKNPRGCTVRASLVILKYYYKQKEFDDKQDHKLVPPWNGTCTGPTTVVHEKWTISHLRYNERS
jgi:hypothetical protein